MKDKRLNLFIVLILFSGCATTVPFNETADGILQSYYDKEFHLSILNFGPPDAIYYDGNDGRILHWQETTSRTRPGVSYEAHDAQLWADVLWGGASYYGTSFRATTPPSVVYNTHYIQLYVNPDGKIYHHRTNALSPAQQQARKNDRRTKQTLQLTAILGGSVALGAVLAKGLE